MSRNGTEIGAAIAAGVPARTPWPAVGDAVAAYLGRAVYYFSAVAAGTFAQSLVGAPPAAAMLTATPSASVPAYIAQAATVVGMPGLAIWPAHQMILHLLSRAALLGALDTYGILITIAQVDASGTIVAVLGQHEEDGDGFYTGDISSGNWQWTDLAFNVPQIADSVGLRLAILLQVLTTSATHLYVELAIGAGGSCVDTSLTAASGSGVGTDRLVASGPTDPGAATLIEKVRSPFGTIDVTEDITGHFLDLDVKPASTSGNGGKLWPSYVKDALQFAAVDCIYSGGLSGWSQQGTGFWVCNTPGSLSSSVLDGQDPATVSRVLDPTDGVQAGIYDLINGAGTNPMPVYFEADGSLGQTPPSTAGVLQATIVDRSAEITAVMPAGYPNLQVWPGRIEGVGNYPVPLTIQCRMVGATTGQAYTLAVRLYRRTTGGDLTQYTGEMGQGDFPSIPTDGSWATIGLILQADQLPNGSTSDVLECWLQAFMAGGPDGDGATFEVAYGGSPPGGFSVPLPTYASLRRSADANATADFSDGMYVGISHGTAHGGQTYQATLASGFQLDVDTQSWASVNAPTPQPTYELLTAAELGLADSVAHQAGASASAGTGEVEILTWTSRDTFAGVTLKAADTWRAHIPVSLGGDTGAAGNIVSFYIRGSNDSNWHLVGQTAALHNADTGVFDAVGSTGSHDGVDYLMGAGEFLQVKFTILTDSTSGITCAVTYNETVCYIETPLTIGFAGTDDHNQLTPSSRFRRDNSSLALQHDAEAVDPPIRPDVTTVAGFLTLPSACTTVVRVLGTEPLLGISTRSDNYESLPLILYIGEATTTDPKNAERDPFRVLVNGSDMTGHDGFSAMAFGMMGMGKASPDNLPPNYELSQYSCIQMICMGGTWRPTGPAFVYQSP